MATAGELIRRVRKSAGITQTELAQRAGTSQAAVARYESGDVSPVVSTLERLLAAGGYRLGLQADSDAPLVDHVRAHRQQIIDLAAAKGAGNVRLFGSAARGQADAGSDIDFLVEFDTSRGLWPLIELADELEQLLGRPVDVAPVEILRDEVAERALAEAIPL
jgi:uncharacterized protein